MKLVMDEKLKHRLIGLAVIISLAAIFAPAIFKKSSQNLEKNYSVNIKLPPKPLAPDVLSSNEKEVFQTIKVAKVVIPSISDEKPLTELVKAVPIKSNTNKIAVMAQANPKSELVQVKLKHAAKNKAKQLINVAAAKQKPKVVVAPSKQLASKSAQTPTANKKDVYALQLASFSQLSNAQSLVNRLHGKGYQANYIKTTGRNGAIYKVFVGHSPRKLEVMKLKNHLASAMQLNGFIVSTGMS